MKKYLRMAAAAAVLGFSLTTGTAANAALVNIINYIDGDTDGGAPSGGAAVGEQAWGAGTRTIDGVEFTATGSNSGGGVAPNPGNGVTSGPFAYLDAKSSGKGAGIGVCQWLTSGGGCTPSSDDNVTGTAGNGDEILSISFEENVRIDALFFRDAGHNPDYGDTAGPAIDVQVDGGGFVTKYLWTGAAASTHFLGETLYNEIGQTTLFSPIFLTAGDVLDLRYNNAQFYLSGFEVTKFGNLPVPLPAGLLLMISGLLGLGFLGRFKAKFT